MPSCRPPARPNPARRWSQAHSAPAGLSQFPQLRVSSHAFSYSQNKHKGAYLSTSSRVRCCLLQPSLWHEPDPAPLARRTLLVGRGSEGPVAGTPCWDARPALPRQQSSPAAPRHSLRGASTQHPQQCPQRCPPEVPPGRFLPLGLKSRPPLAPGPGSAAPSPTQFAVSGQNCVCWSADGVLKSPPRQDSGVSSNN